MQRDQLLLVVKRTIDDACLADSCHVDFVAAAVTIVAVVVAACCNGDQLLLVAIGSNENL